MNKNLQTYLDNISRRPAEAPKITYKPSKVQLLENLLEKAEASLKETPNKELKSELKKLREEYEREIVNSPPIEFVFVKARDPEYKQVANESEKLFNAKVKELIETDIPDIMAKLKDSFANDSLLLAPSKKRADYEYKFKELIAEEIMKSEGTTEAFAEIVADDHPELKLSEDEEKELRANDSKVGIDIVVDSIEIDKLRQDIINSRKLAIIRRNKEESASRRLELMNESVDDLLRRLSKMEVINRAQAYATTKALDLTLYYEARDPAKPIKRNETVVGYAPAFSSVEDITILRENEDNLYAWLLEQHGVVSIMPGYEAIRELAEYEPFRRVVAAMPG